MSYTRHPAGKGADPIALRTVRRFASVIGIRPEKIEAYRRLHDGLR